MVSFKSPRGRCFHGTQLVPFTNAQAVPRSPNSSDGRDPIRRAFTDRLQIIAECCVMDAFSLLDKPIGRHDIMSKCRLRVLHVIIIGCRTATSRFLRCTKG